MSLAAEPEASAPAGLRLASVTSTPVLFPPVKPSVEPKSSSYGVASFYRHHTHTASGGDSTTRAHGRASHPAVRHAAAGDQRGDRRSVTVRVNDRGPLSRSHCRPVVFSAEELAWSVAA